MMISINTKMTVNTSECDIRETIYTNEYPNIFVSKDLHERISEYICIKKYSNIYTYICLVFTL